MKAWRRNVSLPGRTTARTRSCRPGGSRTWHGPCRIWLLAQLILCCSTEQMLTAIERHKVRESSCHWISCPWLCWWVCGPKLWFYKARVIFSLGFLVWVLLLIFPSLISSKSLNCTGFGFQRVEYSALPGLKEFEKTISFLLGGAHSSKAYMFPFTAAGWICSAGVTLGDDVIKLSHVRLDGLIPCGQREEGSPCTSILPFVSFCNSFFCVVYH